jgi:hypothetical protein
MVETTPDPEAGLAFGEAGKPLEPAPPPHAVNKTKLSGMKRGAHITSC